MPSGVPVADGSELPDMLVHCHRTDGRHGIQEFGGFEYR
jgi:hypothetical protein